MAKYINDVELGKWERLSDESIFFYTSTRFLVLFSVVRLWPCWGCVFMVLVIYVTSSTYFNKEWKFSIDIRICLLTEHILQFFKRHRFKHKHTDTNTDTHTRTYLYVHITSTHIYTYMLTYIHEYTYTNVLMIYM